MSEVQQPTQDTPTATTATTEASTTPNAAADATAPAGETTTAAPTGPNVTNPIKEEKVGKNEELITSKAINEGVLNYKGTGLKYDNPARRKRLPALTSWKGFDLLQEILLVERRALGAQPPLHLFEQ